MEELIDYDNDYSLICSSFLQQYGIHFPDIIEKYSFWYINNLIMHLSDDTIFGNILSMRRDELNNFQNSADNFRDTPKNNNKRKEEYRKQVENVLTKRRLEKKKTK